MTRLNALGLAVAAPALLILSTGAYAQTIVAPVSAVIDAGGPGFGSINDTFNQNGLSTGYVSGVTNFDSYIAGNPTHTAIFSPNEWFSNSGTNSATVTYDFGAALGIDRLALWNEESSGIGSLNLLSSLDGVNYSSLGIFNPTDNVVNSNLTYLADVFSFTSTNARFVRFEMSGCPQANPGNFTACAIGEVAFRTATIGGVPEPTAWALMIVGFGAVGSTLRYRRGITKVRFA